MSLWETSPFAFLIPPSKITRNAKFYQVSNLSLYDKNGAYVQDGEEYGPRGSLYSALLSNIGTIDAYETANCPRNAIPLGLDQYKGEVYVYGAKGEAHITKWSPNRILVNINILSEGYLVLNQNYYPGWRVKGNKTQNDIKSINGLLALRIFPFEKEIELYYLPTSFIIGLIVTSITFLLSIIWIFNYWCKKYSWFKIFKYFQRHDT